MSSSTKVKGLVICLCFLIVGNWLLLSFLYEEEDPYVIHDIVIKDVSDFVLLQNMIAWPSLVHYIHNMGDNGRLLSSEYDLLRDCIYDRNWFRMFSDPSCVLLSMRIIEFEPITSIDMITSVITKEERDHGVSGKPAQNGGIRCFFDTIIDDTKAYWKPCRDFDVEKNSESFNAEIVAFHIDQILGFHRNPAVVPRVFSKNDLLELGSNAMNRKEDRDIEANEKIESIFKHCGRDGNLVDGATVAWAPKELRLISKHVDLEQKNEFFVKIHSLTTEEVDDVNEKKFDVSQNSSDEDIYWVLENISANIFAMLTNNFKRFGHNLFLQVIADKNGDVVEYGPFIFIDNDRSKWTYPLYSKGKVPENPEEQALATFCKFPKNIARRFLLLEKLKPKGITLGSLVWDATSVYNIPSGTLFTHDEAAILDSYVEYVTSIIHSCLNRYPTEDVFFNEFENIEFDYFDTLKNNMIPNNPRIKEDVEQMLVGVRQLVQQTGVTE